MIEEMLKQKPMLCSSHRKLGTDIDAVIEQLSGNHLFQPKLDGMRCIAIVDHDDVGLISRVRGNMSIQYPEVVAALRKLGTTAVLDGELVHFGADGKPVFNAMSQRNSQRHGARIVRSMHSLPVTYVAFDMLWAPSGDLRRRPLEQRLDELGRLGLSGKLRTCVTTGNGVWLWREVCEQQLEGLVAKKSGSLYTGDRSSNWVKIKEVHQGSFIVLAVLSTTTKKVGKIEVCVLADGQPKSMGEVGTGWTDRTLAEVSRRAAQYAAAPHDTAPVVVDVAFTGLYSDGRLKHAAFKGIRDDIDWRDCTDEQEGL
jgi:bifunctional non-homologous end joining protein LigD